MSLLTQTNYWLVWADVLLRGGRVALATQMALHCVKVAESVQPPLIVRRDEISLTIAQMISAGESRSCA